MNTIELSAIQISSNRQRQEFPYEKLAELQESIKKLGLLHPVILDTDFNLIAGERRVRAVTALHDLGIPVRHDGQGISAGHIPFVSLGEASELEREEAELEENLIREDLTWQERVVAVQRLERLRVNQAVEGGTHIPSTAEIAKEAFPKIANRKDQLKEIDKQLALARNLHRPEVAKAGSVTDAFKILLRSEEAEKNVALGERVGRTFSSDLHRVFNTDATTWLSECPPEVFDVILCDPPYGMEAEEFGDGGDPTLIPHNYSDSHKSAFDLFQAFARESARITKPEAHMYIFCDIEGMWGWADILRNSGWWVQRTPLIWWSKTKNRIPIPGITPVRQYEAIIYAVKGKRRTLKLAASDVLEFPSDKNLGHAAQKPVALYRELLSRSALPGNTVLDYCCGTGPIFPAAHALKVIATGVELDPQFYGVAVNRIKEL